MDRQRRASAGVQSRMPDAVQGAMDYSVNYRFRPPHVAGSVLVSWSLIDPCVCCRDEIASCSEKAYTHLLVSDAKKMMLFGSEKEVMDYAEKVRPPPPPPLSFPLTGE